MWTKVAAISDVPEGGAFVSEAAGKAIALFKVEGQVYALENRCPHRGGPLGEGFLEGKLVTCPWHAWQFDVTNGVCDNIPDMSQTSYPVKIEGDDVLIDI
jgi:NAD(P)H-dependent nitrite reductase small subunit